MSHVPNDGTKTCTQCGVEQSVHEFRIFGKDDRVYRRPCCQDCENAYTLKWRAKNPGYYAAKGRERRRKEKLAIIAGGIS